MPVVVNDLTLEPQTTPPAETRPAGAEPQSGGAPMPELERMAEALWHREHERALRLWAH
jgi:hypothetical protein